MQTPNDGDATHEQSCNSTDEIGVIHPGLNQLGPELSDSANQLHHQVGIRCPTAKSERSHWNIRLFQPPANLRALVSQRDDMGFKPRPVRARNEFVEHHFGAAALEADTDMENA